MQAFRNEVRIYDFLSKYYPHFGQNFAKNFYYLLSSKL